MPEHTCLYTCTLNKSKALDKKLTSCDKEHLKFEMKPGKNFVIEFSTSAYELAKMEISKIIETPEFNATYNIRAQHSLDLSDITVDTCMKVFNRKQNGAPGSQLKYTMNFYHTRNTMTVNGWRVDIFFINKIFDQLCKAIQDKCSTLNIMNTTLATQISSLQTSTSTVVQQSIDNTNKQPQPSVHRRTVMCQFLDPVGQFQIRH